MLKFTQEQKIHYTLRIAAAMCFIGRGAFGIITKSVWANYFALFGMGRDLSFRFMPFLGSIDILLGIATLVYPLRAMENKRHLDSILKVSLHSDSIIIITVNIAYKTRYQYGDVVTDSIKLGYNREKDAIFLWPF
jgi:hypothetical protein